MAEEGATLWLRRLIPAAVTTNLLIAWAAFTFGWPDLVPNVALGVTIVGTIIAAVAYLGTRRGMQTTKQLGFKRHRDALRYEASSRRMTRSSIMLFAAAALVWSYAEGTTAPAMLAFFTMPLIGIFQSLTATYPADEASGGTEQL